MHNTKETKNGLHRSLFIHILKSVSHNYKIYTHTAFLKYTNEYKICTQWWHVVDRNHCNKVDAMKEAEQWHFRSFPLSQLFPIKQIIGIFNFFHFYDKKKYHVTVYSCLSWLPLVQVVFVCLFSG